MASNGYGKGVFVGWRPNEKIVTVELGQKEASLPGSTPPTRWHHGSKWSLIGQKTVFNPWCQLVGGVEPESDASICSKFSGIPKIT